MLMAKQSVIVDFNASRGLVDVLVSLCGATRRWTRHGVDCRAVVEEFRGLYPDADVYTPRSPIRLGPGASLSEDAPSARWRYGF